MDDFDKIREIRMREDARNAHDELVGKISVMAEKLDALAAVIAKLASKKMPKSEE